MVCRREKIKKTYLKLHQEVLEKQQVLLLQQPLKPLQHGKLSHQPVKQPAKPDKTVIPNTSKIKWYIYFYFVSTVSFNYSVILGPILRKIISRKTIVQKLGELSSNMTHQSKRH